MSEPDTYEAKLAQYRDEYGIEFAKATASNAPPNADIAAVEAMRARRMRALAFTIRDLNLSLVTPLYALECVAELAFFNAWAERKV